MIATKLEQSINRSRIISYLMVAAVSSLATSWFLHTPDLTKKAKVADVIEQQVLPQTQKNLADTKTALKQASCDRNKFISLAAQAVEASDNPKVDTPEWSDLTPCSHVTPEKPVPAQKIIQQAAKQAAVTD